MRLAHAVLANVVALLLLCSTNARALDITDCGAVIPRGETGEMLADLVCAPDEDGVLLENHATLHMNGHAITGADNGVGCYGKCLVEGPGEIFGVTTAMWFSKKRVVVRNVSMHDCPSWGIGSGQIADLDVENVTLYGFASNAIRARKLRVKNLHVSDSGAADAYGAIYADRGIIGTNLTSIGNFGFGVSTNRTVQVTGLTVQDNWLDGVVARQARVTDGILTNNGIFGNHIDIVSMGRPKLENVFCEHSRHYFPWDGVEPWGVCMAD
jgi:hypothetical protein